MILYSLRTSASGYQLAKFDEDFNVAAVYDLLPLFNGTDYSCSCPAGLRPTCRHRNMLPRMISKANTGEFYCYETQHWHRLLAPTSAEALDQAEVANAASVSGFQSDPLTDDAFATSNYPTTSAPEPPTRELISEDVAGLPKAEPSIGIRRRI